LTANDVRAEETRNASRGGVFVLGAKVFFIVIGFVQQSLLKHALGLADYGALARVLAPANIVNNVVVQGSIQGVSRRVAPVRERFEHELRQSLRVHVPLAFAIGIGFALLAEPIAQFQKAPHIVLPLRVIALVAVAYGIYAPLIGVLNGRTRFGRQAGLDVLFAILRTAGLVGVGWIFVRRGASGALGASIGFALAATCIVPIAAVWARARGPGDAPAGAAGADAPSVPVRTYLVGLASVALAQVLVNALMQADITILGRYLSEGAARAELTGDIARQRADEWVGVYRACQLFAFLPYQLVISVAQILFPMVARAHSEGDRERVRTVVGRGMRIATIMAGAIVAIVATLPGTMLRFAYDAEVAARGGEALRVLVVGQGAFALFGVASTVLVSLGRERTSALLSGIALVLVGVGTVYFASAAPFGGAQIAGTATATALGLFVALGLAATSLRKEAGAFVAPATFIRVVIAVALLTAGGTMLPAMPKLLAPVAAAAVLAVYGLLLVLGRELGAEDARAIARIATRRRASADGRASTRP
jgi:stage V sporulation protein B